MQNTKALFLGALFAGVGAVTAINEIGIGLYPPSGQFADGVTRGFYPSDVRSCMGARAVAAIGDRSSQWHWHRCARTLVQTQALWGGVGQDALELTVPYVTLPKRRPGHIPAPWVSKTPSPEPGSPGAGRLRLGRPLSKARAERIRQMGD
jgi:hypothetical protein